MDKKSSSAENSCGTIKPQGELFKITPERLVVPVNDHLDIKISRLTTEFSSVKITLNSFAFDLIRAWFLTNGKEKDHKIELNQFSFSHDFQCYDDVYLRVKLTENPDPMKRKWFLDEKPEGFLKITIYECLEEDKIKEYPLILISENEKVLEMKEKFLEFRKNQNRRERLRKIPINDEEAELKWAIGKFYDFPGEGDPGYASAVEEEKAKLDIKREVVNESVFESHWQKLDEMSDDEIKKLKLERKKELDDLKEQKEKEEREKRKEQEQKKKASLEAAKKLEKLRKKKKKKCVVM
uniref:Major sperm protein n=1 Tax=Caenorhabditis tropicalis TaxID=1561998 RepID=A0A1I7UPH3_9PELO